ncbi:MAG: hypothetical protein DI601_00260 [Azospirillum brasilense]|nr:MAG: hypothetical protein DI601_00260 [Azospirillum brasilense]
MIDVDISPGGDLALGETGDLMLAMDAALTQQRVLRRLLTPERDYLWHQEYGGGLGAYVGEPGAAPRIIAVAREQLGMEQTVQQSPPPDLRISADALGTVVLDVAYVDAASGETQSLSTPLNAVGI